MQLGEHSVAERICRDALKDASRRKNHEGAVAAIANLAGALRAQGRFDDAVNSLRRCLSWLVRRDSVLRRTLIMTSLGLVQAHRGHIGPAQRLYLQARELAGDLGMGDTVRVTVPPADKDDPLREQLAGLTRALGRYAESRIDAERTLLLGTLVTRTLREAAVLLSLGLLAGELGLLGDARAALEAAREKCQGAGDVRFESAMVQALGENAMAARDPSRARQCFAEALALRRRIGYRPGICESLVALGQVAATERDVAAARLCLDEASELADVLQMPGIEALCGATLALLHAREGQMEQARRGLASAHRALGVDGPVSVASRAEGLYFAAQAARALGDEDAFRTYLWQAYDVLQDVAAPMAAEERHRFLKGTSPNKEIVGLVSRMT